MTGRTTGNRYLTNWNQFHQLRLYARGEQSVQKYKDELSINGDLSYLNLDWQPVPILSKFVDIVVNGISSKSYDIKAYAQDPESVKARTEYASKIQEDMLAREYLLLLLLTLSFLNFFSHSLTKFLFSSYSLTMVVAQPKRSRAHSESSFTLFTRQG